MSFSRSLTSSKCLQNADALCVRIAAISILSRRENSQCELIYKLVDKGANKLLAKQVVQNLTEQNLQSDQRFAEMLVNSCICKGRGPLRFQHDMEQHAIVESVFLPVLDELQIDWQSLIQNVYEKKYGDSCVNDYNERAKRIRFLQGRGFNTNQIESVIC